MRKTTRYGVASDPVAGEEHTQSRCCMLRATGEEESKCGPGRVYLELGWLELFRNSGKRIGPGGLNLEYYFGIVPNWREKKKGWAIRFFKKLTQCFFGQRFYQFNETRI